MTDKAKHPSAVTTVEYKGDVAGDMRDLKSSLASLEAKIDELGKVSDLVAMVKAIYGRVCVNETPVPVPAPVAATNPVVPTTAVTTDGKASTKAGKAAAVPVVKSARDIALDTATPKEYGNIITFYAATRSVDPTYYSTKDGTSDSEKQDKAKKLARKEWGTLADDVKKEWMKKKGEAHKAWIDGWLVQHPEIGEAEIAPVTPVKPVKPAPIRRALRNPEVANSKKELVPEV